VSLECEVSVDRSLLEESDMFWTRDTRGTDPARTSLLVIRNQQFKQILFVLNLKGRCP
jgi:hypothetical protein